MNIAWDKEITSNSISWDKDMTCHGKSKKWELCARFISPYTLEAILAYSLLPEALCTIVGGYLPPRESILVVSGENCYGPDLNDSSTAWRLAWCPVDTFAGLEMTRSRNIKIIASVACKDSPFWIEGDSYFLEPQDYISLCLLQSTQQVSCEKGLFVLVDISDTSTGTTWTAQVAALAEKLWGKAMLSRVPELLRHYVGKTRPTATRLLVFQPQHKTRLYLTPISEDALLCLPLLLKAASTLPAAFKEWKDEHKPVALSSKAIPGVNRWSESAFLEDLEDLE